MKPAAFANAIKGFGSALLPLFTTIMGLAELFLRNPSSLVRNIGISLYCLLFQEFAAAGCRQEVIGTLMIHTGSKDVAEVDAALTVFQYLTSSLEQAAELSPFLVFVKGCLDYIESLRPHQVCQSVCASAVQWCPCHASRVRVTADPSRVQHTCCNHVRASVHGAM